MGKKSFRKRGKPSGNVYSHDEDNDVEKNQSGNKLTYMSAPTTSDKSTKYTTFERTKEKIELRLPKDTTTEEGVAEGSDHAWCLSLRHHMMTPAILETTDLSRKQISLGSNVKLSTNEAVQPRLYKR